MTPTAAQNGLSGRSVLVMLLAFFGVVFAVNAYFATAAIQTYTGVVAQEPYRKGLNYNQRIAADARQSTLGWTGRVEARRDGHALLDVSASDGTPITGLAVAGILGRPATDTADRTLTFLETQPGRYESQGSVIDGGSWIVTIAARSGPAATEPVFQLRRRLWLTP